MRHPCGEGRTAEVSVDQARQLLASIDTDHVFGLRDRAVLGTLIYTGARVGALCRLRIQDLRDHGNHRALQFAEKGGKVREIPVRSDLDKWLTAYIDGADLGEAPKGSRLFRTGQGRGRSLTDRPMSPHAVERMLKRRLRAAGLPEILSPHSFRVLVVTDPAHSERAAGGRPVPGRARPPPHHSDLRSPTPTRHPQHRRANFCLKYEGIEHGL